MVIMITFLYVTYIHTYIHTNFIQDVNKLIYRKNIKRHLEKGVERLALH